MANPFIGLEHYVREIKDRRDGQVFKITLRPLSAGDEAAISDMITMRQSEKGEESISPMLGTARLLAVTRAVTDWDLPDQPTEHTISMLDGDLFNQIYEHVEMTSDSGEIRPAEEAAADPLDASSDSSLEDAAQVPAIES